MAKKDIGFKAAAAKAAAGENVSEERGRKIIGAAREKAFAEAMKMELRLKKAPTKGSHKTRFGYTV
jgi:hypothetical protein